MNTWDGSWKPCSTSNGNCFCNILSDLKKISCFYDQKVSTYWIKETLFSQNLEFSTLILYVNMFFPRKYIQKLSWFALSVKFKCEYFPIYKVWQTWNSSSRISSSCLDIILKSLLERTTRVWAGPACVLMVLVSWRTSAAVVGPNSLQTQTFQGRFETLTSHVEKIIPLLNGGKPFLYLMVENNSFNFWKVTCKGFLQWWQLIHSSHWLNSPSHTSGCNLPFFCVFTNSALYQHTIDQNTLRPQLTHISITIFSSNQDMVWIPFQQE